MKLFHLSYHKGLNKLTPRIPECLIKGSEDSTIKRICCSNNISNCLKSINPFRGDILYVYEISDEFPDVIEPIQVVEYVPDAEYTKEYWILNEVKINFVGIIEIIEGGFYSHTMKNKFGNSFDVIDKVKWRWKK
jgi:hypothetical protein